MRKFPVYLYSLLLFVWMIVPLVLTVSYSLQDYQLLSPERRGFIGGANYAYLLRDGTLVAAIGHSLQIIVTALVVVVVLGLAFALLFQRPFWGRSVARVLLFSPFLVMATVSALIIKNLFLNPSYGLLASLSRLLGLPVVDWFNDYPLAGVLIILIWNWTPFAFLALLTALQSFDDSLYEAATLDGARDSQIFFFLQLPHMGRTIGVVVMVTTIFMLGVFAEILTTTNGGPGTATTNLAFLVYFQALFQLDIGVASATAMVTVVFANLVAAFLIRTVAKDFS